MNKLVAQLDPSIKMKLFDHMINLGTETDDGEDRIHHLHSLEMTPKLRAAILKGLPAFEQGGKVSDEGDVFPSFTVGGKEYSSVNPKMDSPNMEKAVTWALDKAARAASYFDEGTPARIYKEAVLDRRQEPFTEKDFSKEDLQSLARAIVQSQAEGRNNLQYEDYKGGPFPVVIGRANYKLDKAGNAVVNDVYDFNNYEKYGSKKWPTDFYSASTWLGRRALPSGVRGVPVSINVPKEMMEESLAAGGEEPKAYADGGSVIKDALGVVSKYSR
jgi:hypothetical protein